MNTKTASDRTLLNVPDVAWATLALTLLAVGLWTVGVFLARNGLNVVAIALMTTGAYLSFTPMHDASHRGLSRRVWLNEFIGRLCALPLLAPFAAFRFVHLEHHKHTNDEHRDPDFWSGKKPLLPLRWVTQDLHYYWVYLAHFKATQKSESISSSAREFVEIFGTLLLIFTALLALSMSGFGALAIGLVLSSRTALTLLAYSFDYLPHRPHLIKAKDNRFLATSVRPGKWWQLMLLNQNLHLIHHLHPAVPFYRYGLLWRAQEQELRAKGVVVLGEK
jgi:beta-carotene hydroxylase